ncbi:hypothetical protein HHK36_002915 [Tetracentron sinense]|uniref:DUF1279 domain-containing protein n=1 Tax=Tetracentron sinense TaxID=13715 RepID=A0A835DS07_TETSI|nr:hypothetical protein HHK36_002915 [Tetracentron sinense]
MAFTGRFRELMKKYGKVALGVHFSVSTASITGLYVAIKNNVDVESIFEKVGISGVSKEEPEKIETSIPRSETSDGFVIEENQELPMSSDQQITKKKNRTAELAASSGGALALAVLCNKALFPIRVPITIALTPPIARFLAKRKIIKNNSCVVVESERKMRVELCRADEDRSLGRGNRRIVKLCSNNDPADMIEW